jgi:hypothetical protein
MLIFAARAGNLPELIPFFKSYLTEKTFSLLFHYHLEGNVLLLFFYDYDMFPVELLLIYLHQFMNIMAGQPLS